MGVGSEGSAGGLVPFFAGSFLATCFVVEGEGSATGGGSWVVDVDWEFFVERIP